MAKLEKYLRLIIYPFDEKKIFFWKKNYFSFPPFSNCQIFNALMLGFIVNSKKTLRALFP